MKLIYIIIQMKYNYLKKILVEKEQLQIWIFYKIQIVIVIMVIIIKEI